jgi:hypothetical protein
MKTFDDLKMLSIYNRYIIKENSGNPSSYENPIIIALIDSNEATRLNLVKTALENMNKYKFYELVDDISTISKEFIKPEFRWNSTDDTIFTTTNKYNFKISVFKTDKLKDERGIRDVHLKFEDRGTSPDPEKYTKYELVSTKTTPTNTSYQIQLSFDKEYNPLFTAVLPDEKAKEYEGYKPTSTFLPINIPTNANIVLGARAI